MTPQLLALLLRHLLTSLGLVGTLGENDLQQLAGGLMIAGGLLWSWLEKRRAAKAAA
jgi:hypothetical protein